MGSLFRSQNQFDFVTCLILIKLLDTVVFYLPVNKILKESKAFWSVWARIASGLFGSRTMAGMDKAGNQYFARKDDIDGVSKYGSLFLYSLMCLFEL